MIACGYMPEIRRQAGEQDAEYQKRITPIVMALPKGERDKIMGAAIKRASLDTSTGKVAVFVAGKAPWHGLGVNVREAVSSADAIRLASLDWTVSKIQLQYLNPVTGAMNDADGKFGIVRDDTGEMLGAVGSMYKPFQNSEGFDFLDSILDEFGAKYESAGAIYGGSKVWMLVHLPRQSFKINGTDAVENYAIFTNSHDGTSAARCFPTSQRVVCANTFRLAQADSDKGLTLRHTTNLKGRVEAAKQALGLTVQRVDAFRESAEVLARATVDPVPYFDGVLDAVLDVTKAEMDQGADLLAAALATTETDRKIEAARIQREINKREAILEEILSRYESDKNGVGGMRGTGWAAFNAVTETADHGKLGGRQIGKDEQKASRRFESVLNGAADEVKQIAYEQVMALVS